MSKQEKKIQNIYDGFIQVNYGIKNDELNVNTSINNGSQGKIDYNHNLGHNRKNHFKPLVDRGKDAPKGN